MIYYYQLLKYIFCIFCLTISLIPGYGQEVAGDEVHFQWAFLMRDKKGEVFSIEDTKVMMIQPEQQFRFYLKPLENSFIYILFYSSIDGLQQLYPNKFTDFKHPEYYEKESLLPAGEDAWFTYEGEAAEDKLYLFASSTRLKKLENLVKNYRELYLKGKKTKEQEVLKSVVDEMERLVNKSSLYTVNIPPPVSIAGGVINGAVRSEDDIKIKTINGGSLYAEIITFKTK